MGGFTALPSRTLHRRVNSDSAVSGNIRLRAEKLIGMPHSILHAFNTFQFNAGRMCVTSKHPHHFLHETKTWIPQFNKYNIETIILKKNCIFFLL